jgi:hypothetical protein
VIHSGMMSSVILMLGAGIVVVVLWDVFETIVLPRRVTRKYRLTRLFYRYTWISWAAAVQAVFRGRRQETLLSYYGPFSLIFLLSLWAAGLIFGFALVYAGTISSLRVPDWMQPGLGAALYASGTNFFTLGLGDVTPLSPLARLLTVGEAGLGLGLLALVIGYLPSINQSFSRREAKISLLDARAGSPPTAVGMLVRQCHDSDLDALLKHFMEWEQWSAELLESHLSYPVLAYFRSQHDNQSWVSALTAILDTSALVIAGTEGPCARQAQLTFAMARHAVVDLALIFHSAPFMTRHDRLSEVQFEALRTMLANAGIHLREGEETGQALVQLRQLYEPYVYALSRYFRLAVPPWVPDAGRKDNWEKSAWRISKGAKMTGTAVESDDEHF